MARQRPAGILSSTLRCVSVYAHSKLTYPKHHADERVNSCRATLQAVNLVLAVAGLCMLGYAAYMFIDFENITFSSKADFGGHHNVAHWLMAAKRNASPWYGRVSVLLASLC